MARNRKAPAYGMAIYALFILSLGSYFAFASVQGDFGLFRRIQIEAEKRALEAEQERLIREVATMRNKTRRLSDDYLDLDLLDERARDILGMLRPDEIVIR